MKILPLILFIFTGCSSQLLSGEPKLGKSTYSFTDVGGNFSLFRETKVIEKKIVTRNQLNAAKGTVAKVLEKTILVSQIGSIKSKKARLLTVRPFASEFTVWLEGQKYTSKMRLNTKSKSMNIMLSSPEKKWQGTTEIQFPKGKYFCFYGQLPECLHFNSLLAQANANRDQKYEFFMVWDGYPFIQDQLTHVGQSLFAPATLKFDGENQGLFRYIVGVEGQIILYHFTRNYELVKMAWITQGITIVPPGEEIAEDD